MPTRPRSRRSSSGGYVRTGRLPTNGVALAALAILCLIALGVVSLINRGDDDATARSTPAPRTQTVLVSVSTLPREAATTLRAIDRGGPFPYSRDGVVFGNREGLLPRRARGYYREYTVRTPGSSDRGARRIVTGSAGERWYTADHYASFVRVRWPDPS